MKIALLVVLFTLAFVGTSKTASKALRRLMLFLMAGLVLSLPCLAFVYPPFGESAALGVFLGIILAAGIWNKL
ncbi:MAG: hypothetical protein K2X27_05895 [Candidatus Obscuribacterales bacterium]|nr:hypothetical protein [Candidatus Obscuribacterales bacterium]